MSLLAQSSVLAPMAAGREYLNNLNGPQRAAVETVDGPLLCLAGAGSGKTRVLTTRIAHMVHAHGIDAGSILALTFTRKAASEMRRRLAGLIGDEDAARLTVGTFHSIGAQILREYGSLISLRGKFSIDDDDYTLLRLRRVMEACGIEKGSEDWRSRDVAEDIAIAKQRLILYAAERQKNEVTPFSLQMLYRTGIAQALPHMTDGDWNPHTPEMFARVFTAYQASLEKDEAIDFTDLVALPVLLFLERPEVLSIYRERWAYLSVDEYQDTDRVQDLFLRLLADGHRNLCAVGDDDQSIYGWRGAEVENIRTFPERFAPCSVVLLTDNYRSTPNILRVANAALAAQDGRFPKELRPNLPEGEKVRVWSCSNQETEAEAVVRETQRLLDEGVIRSLDDVYVLYRLNAVATAMEASLRRNGITYRIVGHTRFTLRKEIRDLIAFLRLATNPNDTISFQRIVNVPSRGIGPATMEAILQAARTSILPIVDICANAARHTTLKPAQVNALGAFAAIIRRISQAAESGGPASAVHEALSATTYRDHLIKALAEAERDLDEEECSACSSRLASIEDFVAFAEEFASMEGKQSAPTITDFLDRLLTLSVQDDEGEEEEEDTYESGERPSARGSLTLMSVHAAKGLEAPVVFVLGLDEGVFPVSPEELSEEEMEEEERLFYVAVTRAEHRLYLSSARCRELRRNDIRHYPTSRFIYRLPDDGLIIEDQM